MRVTGALFPLFFVALSNWSDSKFAKIADDLCLGQILSFCVPILARSWDSKNAPKNEMNSWTWMLIAITSFSIGGMSTFASGYPAESTEELLMFMNSTFPDSDVSLHQFLIKWPHNFAPYLFGLSTKFIPDWNQKNTLLLSLAGMAVSYTCSLVAVLSSSGTIWQGCLLIVSRITMIFFAAFGFGAAATFCGDICSRDKLTPTAVVAIVTLTMGQIMGGLLANLMDDHVDRLWWLYLPPLVVVTNAFFFVALSKSSPHSFFRSRTPLSEDQIDAAMSNAKDSCEYYLDFDDDEQLDQYVQGIASEVEQKQREKAEIDEASAICLCCCGCLQKGFSKAYSYLKCFPFSPFTSLKLLKGFFVLYLAGMTGTVIQIDVVKEMLRPDTPPLVLDVLPSLIYFLIIMLTVFFAGVQSVDGMQRRFVFGYPFILELVIAIHAKNVWLIILFSVFTLLYCMNTLPVAVLIVHKFATPGHGTLWFGAALGLTRFLSRFVFSWIVHSGFLSRAWAYFWFYFFLNNFILGYTMLLLLTEMHGVWPGLTYLWEWYRNLISLERMRRDPRDQFSEAMNSMHQFMPLVSERVQEEQQQRSADAQTQAPDVRRFTR